MSGPINCPAPLPEDPAPALLVKLLAPAPYVVPEKKAKKKKTTGTRKSTHNMVLSDSSSDESETPSSRENKEEEEESSPPPQRREERKGRPPQGGRPKGPGRGKPLRRTMSPTPTRMKRSGRTGPSVWQNRKCSDTRVTHDIPFVAQLSLMSNIIMQPAPCRTQRVVERLPGFIGRELSSAYCLPPHCG